MTVSHEHSHEHSQHDGYRSPLETRNASREMRALWSERRKFGLWRRIWLALAESQHELGMPVTRAQVDAILDPEAMAGTVSAGIPAGTSEYRRPSA